MRDFTGVFYLVGCLIMFASWLPFVPFAVLYVGWLFFTVGFISDIYHNYYKDGSKRELIQNRQS